MIGDHFFLEKNRRIAMNHKIAFTFAPFKPEGYDELREKGCEVFMPEPGFVYDPEDLSALPADAEVIASSFTHPITEEVMSHFPHLRLIANYGVGFNNIDLDAAKKRGIAVSNTPRSVIQGTAELTMALLLSLTRRITVWDSRLRRDRDAVNTGLMGTDLGGKTIGLVGFGNIARRVADFLRPYGVTILYNKRHRLDPLEEEALGVTYADMETLLRESDIVSLHTPLNADSRHLINADTIALMRDGAILVNVARGAVMDEQAVVDALRSGKLAGAAFDVFEHSDKPLDALYDMENVVMTPHVGTQTTESRLSMEYEHRDNILGFLLGDRRVAYVYNPSDPK